MALTGKIHPSISKLKSFKTLPTPSKKVSKKIKRVPKQRPAPARSQAAPDCSQAMKHGIRAYLTRLPNGPMGSLDQQNGALCLVEVLDGSDRLKADGL